MVLEDDACWQTWGDPDTTPPPPLWSRFLYLSHGFHDSVTSLGGEYQFWNLLAPMGVNISTDSVGFLRCRTPCHMSPEHSDTKRAFVQTDKSEMISFLLVLNCRSGFTASSDVLHPATSEHGTWQLTTFMTFMQQIFPLCSFTLKRTGEQNIPAQKYLVETERLTSSDRNCETLWDGGCSGQPNIPKQFRALKYMCHQWNSNDCAPSEPLYFMHRRVFFFILSAWMTNWCWSLAFH